MPLHLPLISWLGNSSSSSSGKRTERGAFQIVSVRVSSRSPLSVTSSNVRNGSLVPPPIPLSASGRFSHAMLKILSVLGPGAYLIFRTARILASSASAAATAIDLGLGPGLKKMRDISACMDGVIGRDLLAAKDCCGNAGHNCDAGSEADHQGRAGTEADLPRSCRPCR